MPPRWRVVSFILVLMGLAAAWGGWRWREQRRDRAELASARAAMDQGRYGAARILLAGLLDRNPAWDEAAYELGVCELARGRGRAALEAWQSVPERSPWAGWVEVRRSRMEMDQGRYSDCEALLRSAADRPGSHRGEARWGLVLLLRLQGRFAEARRSLRDGFEEMTDPVETLQRLYRLDHDLFPAEGVRRALEAAAASAPDDDRVWLGRAHLALRLGRFDEALEWLDRCRRSRPEDLPVWRLRLEWALAAGRPEAVRGCLPHLPARLEPPERAAALEAFFATQRGDRGAECEAWRRVLQADAADAPALERLTVLEREAGHPSEAAALRRRKAELEQTRRAYERLLFAENPEARAAELEALAMRLCRRFDARRWALLAGKPAGDIPAEPAAPDGATLADLLPGIASGSPAAAVAEKPGSVPSFVDDAEAAGLHFTQFSGSAAGRLIPPVTSSGGVGLLDYDGDGWLDVYLVQGGAFPPSPGASPGDRLFRNRGDGTFEDATERSGIARMPRGYGHGVTVGDYDNDGHPDLFITRWRSYALYRNRGDGSFEDVTARAGLGGDRDWPTSAAFADLDGDGDLDLYVCHYLKWDENDPRTCVDSQDPTIYNCSPLDFEALPDHLFRNDGGRFVDVTRDAGIEDRNGRGLGVVAADVDGDGKIDVFVANDLTANYLFRNLGSLRFEEAGLSAGVAGNASGAYQAGMGVACGDLDGDGLPDLAVTNFYNESTSFFRNLGQGIFSESAAAIGLAGPSRYLLGFGIVFLDADNDGWLDVLTANGHVYDGRPQFPWQMPLQLLRNEGGPRVRLADVSAHAGPPFQALRMGRGLASGDLDNDGRIDALVVSQDQPMAYLHNRSAPHHFVTLDLEGTASGRDAVGARVTVRAGGRNRVSLRAGGGSFQSASDPRLRFGLETAGEIEGIEIRWPSGRVDRYAGPPVDSAYLLREGDATPHPLKGWKPRH
jgi:tetratricopeptide (TPR) repeat protein